METVRNSDLRNTYEMGATISYGHYFLLSNGNLVEQTQHSKPIDWQVLVGVMNQMEKLKKKALKLNIRLSGFRSVPLSGMCSTTLSLSIWKELDGNLLS